MIGQLAQNFPTSDWAKIAKGSFLFGSGGIASTGAQCGNFMAAGALLKQMGAENSMVLHFLRWFESTPLPTNMAYIDYRSNTWTPTATAGGKTSVWGGSGMPIPLNNAPKVASETTTCHGAHTKWKVAASSWLKAMGVGANTDRCGKTTYDTAYKLATMINDWKAGTAPQPPADPTTGCFQSDACHNAYPETGVGTNKIYCTPCHDGAEAITPNHGG